jgi:CRP-like cAMP-binding protein
MPNPKSLAKPPQNRLLSALPRRECARLAAVLEPISLSFKEPIYDSGVSIRHVVFPTSGIVSLVTDVDEESTVEVATVGNEGMVGLPVFLGANSMPGRALCQIPGDGLRMDARAFKKEADRPGKLRQLLLLYTQATLNFIAQTAACNRVHSVEERCARWLLISQDRVGTNRIPLTQEFMGQMLGVRRATVNVAAGMLHKAGLIRYARGRITVLDRRGLEKSACECYRKIRAEFDRLFGTR